MTPGSPLPPSLDALEALTRHAVERPETLALSDGEREVSYKALAAHVAGLAHALAPLPDVVGLLAPNGIPYVLADLALAAAGKTAVPLPWFFSAEQLGHIVRDSGLGAVVTTPEWTDKAAALGRPVHEIDDAATADPARMGPGTGGRVIYTSGTTGAPKGVRLGTAQLNASLAGLLSASGAGPGDRYLSVLPYPLLLEQICGIHVPLAAGAQVFLATEAATALMRTSDPTVLIGAAERFRPTASVLVPDMLRGWVAGLTRAGRMAPENLRFVAVGGAPIPAALAEAAWAKGVPVYEGYGLSECCSVVAVNRPGDRRVGTVGRPLDGLGVEIVEGEIVVSGPTVMDGYLNRDDAPGGRWATGDLGHIDGDGRLVVDGRKDNVIALASGRNLSPEWIEGLLLADPRIGRAVIVGAGRARPLAVVVPSPLAGRFFDDAPTDEIAGLIDALVAEAPDYAKPDAHVVLDDRTMAEAGLLTANGRPRRAAIAAYVAKTDEPDAGGPIA